MYKHLLVPLDGSDNAELALEPALAIAEAMGARISLLAVALRYPESRIHVPVLDDKALDRAREYLQGLAEKRYPHGVAMEVLARQGSPADEIVAAAVEGGIDLIVMTTHTRADSSPGLGSTAWKIVQHASCPILLVRAGA